MKITTKKTPTVGQYTADIAINVAIVGSFYAWQIHGSEVAGNLYLFLAWLTASLGLFIGIGVCAMPAYATPRVTWPAAWRWFERARIAAMILSAAWLSHEVLALTLIAAVLFLGAARAKLAEAEVAK